MAEGDPRDVRLSVANSVIDLNRRVTLDMSDNAAKASIANSESRGRVATATYATPARQESVRAALFTAAILGLAFGGHWAGLSERLIEILGIAMTAMYGVPKAIEKWRTPKALPPALSPPTA